jgi:hypothetical protein
MDAKSLVIVLLAIVMVLLLILGLASTMPSSNWTEIAQGTAGYVVVIIAFAVAVGSIIILTRRR